MSPDFIKERIKLETELLRLYFVLFLTDVSGTVAFFTREKFSASVKEVGIIALGFVFSCILFILIVRYVTKIKKLINHLNP